jgi:undecaprenyl-diphosphatase
VGTALLIGVGQGLAVLRGLSRSGTTITLGLAGGLSREEAFNYSFLLSVPAILGALVLELDPGALMAPGGAATHIAGVLAALPVGYLSLILLSAIVRRGGLHIFAPWCWALGGIALWLGSAS